MLFNSIEFLLFFPIVTLIYFLLPHKIRWFHLLLASCFFYMCFVPVYILILFATILVDYFAGIMIEKAEGRRRKAFLIVSLVTNIGILVFFKYFNFISFNINHLFRLADIKAQSPLLRIILPLGLSFHTFQAMSYTIEVFRGNQKAEKHLGIYSLYVMFYPQLVAGPIERPQNLLHQFHTKHSFDYNNLAAGCRLMLWGMFKKVVIADRVATFCDPVFNAPHQHSAISLAIAAIFFVFQLYCDFSGYSDIALGSARVMGFHLMKNFDLPLRSKTISEFWRRWHISLSTWLGDYLFNPLVFALRSWGDWAIVTGTMITFFISGIWHGAGWKFATYGLFFGVAMSYEFLFRKQRKKAFKKLPQWLNIRLSVLITIGYVALADVFFRARNFSESAYIVRKFSHIPREFMQVLRTKKIAFLNIPALYNVLLPSLLLIVLLELIHFINSKYKLADTFANRPALFRWTIYYAAMIALVYFGVYEKKQFIYFQF